MKKNIILLFILCIHLQSYCQKPFTLSSGECSDSMLLTIKGKYWFDKESTSTDISDVLYEGQQSEVIRRMEQVHNLLKEIYQPTGNEGYWHWNTGTHLFLHDVELTTGIPLCTYSYRCAFEPYGCTEDNPKEIRVIDAPSWCKVFVNDWGELVGAISKDSSMLINGVPFQMLAPVKEIWKGYELCYQNDFDSRTILIHRKGMLPYIPITRKQYLDYCIKRFNKIFDDLLKSSKEMPFSTKDQINETVDKVIKNKKEIIQHYENELEQNRTANLLDSPAIVRLLDNMYPDVPIFASGAEDGGMLVTENPAYIRKDLPKYVPQFIVLYWKWVSNFPLLGGAQGEYYSKIMEANFPVEKLQAMIDK